MSVTGRYLKAIRLSVKKDESTSPERQNRAIDAKIAQLGGALAGTASDLNVSASKVDPFSRPQLGAWLNERTDDFDGIVWWRWDRAVRSMSDLSKLIEWAQDNEKHLVFTEGFGFDIDFDFRGGNGKRKTSMAMIIAMLVAWAAEMESQANSERTTGSQAYMRERGRWGGGMVPYGFEPVRMKGDDRGWSLIHSPDTAPVLRQIIGWVHNRKSLLWIANKLNEERVPSPRDAWEQIKKRRSGERGIEKSLVAGEEKAPRLWNTNGLKAILTSRALLGETEYEGKPVLDDEGQVVRRGEPFVSQTEFLEIQAALAERAMVQKVRYEDPNPLLGIAFCARCGERYYMKQEVQKRRTYTSLSCRSRHGGGRSSCKQPTVSMAYAVTAVSEVVLSMIGAEPQQTRRYVPGSDRSEELVMWQERIKYLKEEWDEGLLNDREEYKNRLLGYQARIAEIGDEPVTQARYEYVNTGKTYNEVWAELDVDDRRQLLEDLGVKVFLGRGECGAADRAESNFGGSESSSHRRSVILSAEHVSRLLTDVHDGRIKKDFQLWFYQDKAETVQDVVANRRSY